MYLICKENTRPVIKKNGMKPALIKNTFSKNFLFFLSWTRLHVIGPLSVIALFP